MTTKHTAAPWTQNHDDVIVGDDPENIIAGCEWRDGEDGFDETLANARLIAAAPELLEALEAMLRSYEFLKPPNSPISDSQKKAKAAIAKATGESA